MTDEANQRECAQRIPLGFRPALDGVRAVAILVVIAGHSAFVPKITAPLGVDIFFVLSGYLITTLLLDEYMEAGRISLRSFYVRRVCRLSPALALLLVAYVTYALLTGVAGSESHVLEAAAIGVGYVENFFLAASSGHVAGHLVPLWSLATEEQFYLLWPPILILALRRGVSLRKLGHSVAIAVTVVVALRTGLFLAGASSNRIMYGLDTHSDGLLLGIGTAIALKSSIVARVHTGLLVLAAAVCFVALATASAFHSNGALVTATSPLFPLACAVIIASLVTAPSTPLARILAATPLQYLGTVSYGVYLWHVPLMRVAGVPAGLMLTAIVAPFSYRYLEAPIRRWGRKRLSRPALAGRVPTASPLTA